MSKNLRTKIRKGRAVDTVGSFSAAEKEPLSDRLSVPSPAADGKLATPVYLVDGFHRRAVSTTVDGFQINE